MPENIYVTRPTLPPLQDFVASLESIWESRRLTNKGPFHDEFEAALAEHLGVPHVSLFCNGTIALQTALQALRITGEVITTPYSFPATTHAIYWNRCMPVFCDIEPGGFNIDPEKVESLISPNTTAIMPVHVYGIPCALERIQHIADIYGLKVIYDAAHAFGVRVHGESVLNFGDLSVLSFHATKIFNTIEGGALISHDPKMQERIDYLRNFGFADETTVVAPGINGKMNELQAAWGLLQLKTIDAEIAACKEFAQRYREGLSGVPGITCIEDQPEIACNHCYFPILVDETAYGMSRDALYETLKTLGIYGRRYFYPLLSHLPSYRNLPSAAPGKLPEAVKRSLQIICLPIYADLGEANVDRVVNAIAEHARPGR